MGYQEIQTTDNMVNTISSASSNSVYPTAQAVYDFVSEGAGNILFSSNQQAIQRLGRIKYQKTNDNSTTKTIFPQLLHVADIHGDSISLSMAVKLANYSPTISGILVAGDTVISEYNENTLSEAVNILNACSKPWYPVIGNHDASGNATNQLLYENFIYKAIINNQGDQQNPKGPLIHFTTGSNYYYVDINSIRLIVLDEFDNPSSRGQSGAVSRAMSQTQLTWFINTLKDAASSSIPVVIALHTPMLPYQARDSVVIESSKIFCANDTNTGTWPNTYLCNSNMYYTISSTNYYSLLCDIVYNFINKGNTDFSVKSGNSEVFSLPADFSTYNNGIFLGWLSGHNHRDLILSYNKNNIKQYNIMPVTSSLDDSQMTWADMAKNSSCNETNIAFTTETLYYSGSTKKIYLNRLGTDGGFVNPGYTYVVRDFEELIV